MFRILILVSLVCLTFSRPQSLDDVPSVDEDGYEVIDLGSNLERVSVGPPLIREIVTDHYVEDGGNEQIGTNDRAVDPVVEVDDEDDDDDDDDDKKLSSKSPDQENDMLTGTPFDDSKNAPPKPGDPVPTVAPSGSPSVGVAIAVFAVLLVGLLICLLWLFLRPASHAMNTTGSPTGLTAADAHPGIPVAPMNPGYCAKDISMGSNSSGKSDQTMRSPMSEGSVGSGGAKGVTADVNPRVPSGSDSSGKSDQTKRSPMTEGSVGSGGAGPVCPTPGAGQTATTDSGKTGSES